MKFSEMQPGRYSCKIIDWGLTTVEQLDDALKVIIQLSIMVPGEDTPTVGWWESLVKKKDGSINEKALKTLLSSGFESVDIYTLNSNPTALDKEKDMEVTIVRDNEGRIKAEWLNSAGGGSSVKKDAKKKKDLVVEGALATALKNKKEKRSKEADEELPF